MKKNQLDFNAPFLSVRRLSSTLDSSNGRNKTSIKNTRPNRQKSLPLHKSNPEVGDLTKPVAVPFNWEDIPGRAKSGPQPQPPSEPSNTPRLPPRLSGNLSRISGEFFYDKTAFSPKVEDHSALIERLKEEIISKDDDEYSDALDTLSPPESFLLSCSVSCLNGYDSSEGRPSESFNGDSQTRNILMSRFIPAAKAMVLETPQYVSKKQTKVIERPKEGKKVVSGELRPLILQYGSKPVSNYSQTKGGGSDDDEEKNVLGKKLGTACGFFRKLRGKNSLGLLNPVPAIKLRAQSPTTSAVDVRRMARTAYSGPLPQTNEKHAWEALYRKKSPIVVRSQELRQPENKLTDRSNHLYHSGELYNMTDESSFYTRSRGGRISPYRNETPRSPFHDGAKFLGIPKEVEAKKTSPINKVCDDILDISYKRPGSASPVVEKTLYIDSVININSQNLSLACLEQEGIMSDSFKALVKTREIEESSIVESFIKGTKGSNASLGGKKVETKAYGELDQDVEEESESLGCSKINTDRNLDMIELNNENTKKADDVEDPRNGDSLQSSPLPPSLLKSPSESWLWRTLPAIALRNPFSPSHPRKQGQKNPLPSPKWETIVKTSNVRHDHVRYSKELIPHLSQRSKA